MNGRLIKKYREAANIKRSSLANTMGIDVSTLQRIENDEISVTVERLIEISRILKISIIEFFEEEHLRDPDPSCDEKYGNLESAMMKYLKGQIALEKKKNEDLLQMNKALMQEIKNLNNNFKRLMDHFTLTKFEGKKTKSKK